MSSSTVLGIHNVAPSFLFSFGSHGWKGKTVHRRRGCVMPEKYQMQRSYLQIVRISVDVKF